MAGMKREEVAIAQAAMLDAIAVCLAKSEDQTKVEPFRYGAVACAKRLRELHDLMAESACTCNENLRAHHKHADGCPGVARETSPLRERIFTDINKERQRQRQLHPDCETLPDGTGAGGYIFHRDMAQRSCDRAEKEERLTHACVLEEEAFEALAETDLAKLRKELVETAAVCVKWIEDLDRRKP